MIATLSNIQNESPRVKRFFLDLPTEVDFVAGQFVVLSAIINGETTHRSYSIASATSALKLCQIELCISLNDSGLVTPWLFGLQPGDTLEISPPQGGFVLRDASGSGSAPASGSIDFIFVCTGTGVAPFRSMIDQALKLASTRQVHLVFGNRKMYDVLYHKHWMDLVKSQPKFQYWPTLSREEEPRELWRDAGKSIALELGYVHDVYTKLVLGNLGVQVYVCGWDAMCKEARVRLKSLGLTRRQYFFEQYDG